MVKPSPMKLREEFARRLVIESDDPGLSLVVRTLAVLAAISALVQLFPFSSSALLMIILAFALWQLAGLMDVSTEAVFDTARARFSLVHRRKGAVVSRTEATLHAVEAVVVEARRERGAGGVSMRPAVVVNGRRVALSHASFARPAEALQLVHAIKTFIGLPHSDIVEDSIRWGAQLAAGRSAAGRLATDPTAVLLSEPPAAFSEERSVGAVERAAESSNVAVRLP